MKQQQDIRRQFIEELDFLNSNFSPLRAAALLACMDNPHLDLDTLDETLESWADDIRPALLGEEQKHRKIKRFNEYFSRKLGFRPARRGASALENLHPLQVLHSRRGRPAILALIYHDLAGRLQIPLRPLAVPGTFLFASSWLGDADFIDPAGPRILSLNGLQRRLEELFSGREILLKPQYLESLSDRRLFERYLVTLKSAFQVERRYLEALRLAEWRLLLDPRSDAARVDRGMLLFELNRFEDAHADLKGLLPGEDASPVASRYQDRARVNELLASVEKAARGA